MRVAFTLLAGAGLACATAPAMAQTGSGQPSNNPRQAALDQKYGVAPAGTWWDEQGRLCRTNTINGKKVRNCDRPATPSTPQQAALAKKFGPAPEGQWWDEQGRLCRTNNDADKTRRCEKPGTIR